MMKPGAVGEDLVRLWASQAGVTANAVQRDEFAWDFCLQFRREANENTLVGPLDLIAPETTTFVQVKTTAVGATHEDVKLANWQRMVKDPYPWFFVRVSLDRSGEPERVYLIHVGPYWIERVLRRLRELSDDPPKLSDATLALTWTDAESVAQPFAPNLRDRILREVGTLTSYVTRKAEVIQHIGYSDASFEATITTPTRTPEDYERLVDFAIGLTSSLPITSFVVKRVRFGMPQTIKDHRDVLGGTMSFGDGGPPSIARTTLIFTDRDRATSVAHDFDTYLPTMFGDVPPKYFKARFATKAISVIARPADGEMSLAWHFHETMPLSELASAIELLSLCADAKAGIEIAYEARDKRIPIAHHPHPVTISPDGRRLVDVVRHATFLAKHLSLDLATRVLPADLDECRSQLLTMRGMFDKSFGPVDISIVVPTLKANVTDKCVAIALPLVTRIGDQVVMVLVAYFGPAAWDATRSRVSVTNGQTRLLRKWVIPLKDWTGMARYAAEINGIIDALNKSDEFDLVTGPDNLNRNDPTEQ